MIRVSVASGRPAVRRMDRQYRSRRGQAMVEFALVAPVFLLAVFGMVDGGLLLFSANAVDNAATIGSNALAALGNQGGADQTALGRMATNGFGNTQLIQLGEVDVEKLVTDPLTGFTDNPDGTPMVATDCGASGSVLCVNRYSVSVSGAGTVSVTLLNSLSPCVTPGGCAPWPPSVRDIGSGTSSFAGLVIHYTYPWYTHIRTPMALTSTKTFRLEPQT